MSLSTTLKDYLIDKIESLSTIQAVYGYESLEFSKGVPAVTVTMPILEGEFASNTEDSRTYSFTIRVFFPLGKDIETPKTKPREQYAEDIVAEVVEDIIDSIDTDFSLDNLTLSSNMTVKFATASDMRPYYLTVQGGEYRVCEITLRIYTEKTVV